MTNTDFEAAYNAARRNYNTLTREVMEQVKSVMEQAAAKAAQIVTMTEINDLSDLTSASWRQIQSELEQAAARIRETLDSAMRVAVSSGADDVYGITESFLTDLVDQSGGKITQAGIANMFIGINQGVIEDMINRLSKDGYSFSDRVWRVGEVFQQRIKDVIEVGTALGRDILDIAKDIEVYVEGGRRKLLDRYGPLERGTASWKARIKKNVDYNAVRLVRSEMYMSLQNAAVQSGIMNPACDGMFDWIRNTSEDWNCRCPEFERGSPYVATAVPGYPHPNCLCTIMPHLRDMRTFNADIKRWANGEDVGYLDEWYETQYLQIA